MADLRADYLPLSGDNESSIAAGAPASKRLKSYIQFVSGCLMMVVFVLSLIASLDITDISGSVPRINRDASASYSSGQTIPTETVKPAVSRGKSAGVSEKTSRSFFSGVEDVTEYQWNNSVLNWQRSAFHFQPFQNWMNDPNGPLFYKGWYHFFYQYNPNAAVWGDIVWAHAVSKDLIHWFDLPIAMKPDHWYDAYGVWTGSATILPNGKIVMLYTGSTKELIQVQNLAYPADPSDPLLINWVKYSNNPVLVPPPGIHYKDFRDPTTAWLTSEGKWRIIIGSKINRTGVSLVYDTKDFKHFEKLDKVLHGVPNTGMWECVDFYPISKTAENGLDTSVNGPGVKHVMKTSLDDTRNDHYAIGTYFDDNVTWVPDNREIDVGIGLRYDYGTFYASKTFYDQNKNRRVLWGWITESDSENADVQKGWASLQSIPRTVLFDQKTRTNLIQWPVDEVEQLRSSRKDFEFKNVKPGSLIPLEVGMATQLDIMVEFDVDKKDLVRTSAEDVTYTCNNYGGASHRGALGPFGISVLADETLTEQTPVYFYIAKGKDDKLKTFFCNDKSRSSLATDVDKKIYGNFVPVLKGEKLSMRILVDHSIIESFAQGGRSCITSRVYPTKAIYKYAKVLLFNNATDIKINASITIWKMDSAMLQRYPENELNVKSL